MRHTALSILTISMLTGCVSPNSEQQNQLTLNAIKQSETSIKNEIDTIKLGLSNQSDYIDSLETEVIELRSEIAMLQQITRTKNKRITKPKHQTTATENTIRPNLSEPIILGAIENIQIDNIDTLYPARIDTGSTTSSLHASGIEEFEREGKKWVRFHLTNSDVEKQHWIEAPIVRYANIRFASSEEKEKRAVVELWIKIGNIHEKSQFTLANRSQMSHPILLGREFIQDIALVDVSKTFLLSKPNKNI